MKDITMLVAHPDDEVIFGWPVLEQAKLIICCSSDANNPGRAWCRQRSQALKEVCTLVGAELICFHHNSEFYRLNARAGELLKLQKEVSICLDWPLFTHNAWGEYGHLDHILVNRLAAISDMPMLTTDMATDGGWLAVEAKPEGELVKECQIDLDLYSRCKAIYENYGCWTWSKDPIKKAKLYASNQRAVQ